MRRNPQPIKRARRIEWRRKHLGAGGCFYCSQSNIECLERDHPVGVKRDPMFTRVSCRNCHRQREMERDLARLTKNGLHKKHEASAEKIRSYLLLLAMDQESIATVLESPNASPGLIAAALRSTADSLRRQAAFLPPIGNSFGASNRKKNKQRRRTT